MLHVFSINRVKIIAHTPTTIVIKGRREYPAKLLSAMTLASVHRQLKKHSSHSVRRKKYIACGRPYTYGLLLV
jgi:hypothetical protein